MLVRMEIVFVVPSVCLAFLFLPSDQVDLSTVRCCRWAFVFRSVYGLGESVDFENVQAPQSRPAAAAKGMSDLD